MWIPAHRSLEDYIDRGLSPLLHLGNMWADWFARRGADSHAGPATYEEIYKVERQFAKNVASYIAWAMQRTLKVGLWEPAESDAPRKIAGAGMAPVQITSHSIAKLSDGSYTCRRRARSTARRSVAAWNLFLRTPCQATRLDGLRAEAMIQFGAGVAF